MLGMSDRGAAARLRTALDLHEAGVQMMRQRLRREHPNDSADQLRARLGRWLHDRPGARHGDAVGPRGTWPRESR